MDMPPDTRPMSKAVKARLPPYTAWNSMKNIPKLLNPPIIKKNARCAPEKRKGILIVLRGLVVYVLRKIRFTTEG